MVTLQFSNNTPCITNVIPAMDKMHTDLTASSENEDYSPTICAALKLGIDLLDKYYSLMDNSGLLSVSHIILSVV